MTILNRFLWILVMELIGIVLAEPPKLQPFNFPETVTFGDRVNVFCGIKSGSKPLKYKWLQNGKVLKNTENLSIDMQTDYSVLTIVPSSRNDGGNYTCLVENEFGKDSFTAQLFLKAPPSWIKYPKDLKTVEGSCIELECRAEGLPQPEIIWKLATGSESFSKIVVSNRLQIALNGSLLLCPASQEDSGNYMCEATNNIVPSLKKTAEIMINGE